MQPITVESFLSKADYLDFCRFRSYYLNKASRNLLLFPLLLFLFAMFNLYLGNIALMWVLLVLAAVIPLWMWGSLRAYVAKDVKQFGLNVPRVFYTLVLDERGIHIDNESEHADYRWQQVWKLCRTKHAVYLFMTPQRGFIVPVRCLADPTGDALWALGTKMLPVDKCIVKKPFYEKD